MVPPTRTTTRLRPPTKAGSKPSEATDEHLSFPVNTVANSLGVNKAPSVNAPSKQLKPAAQSMLAPSTKQHAPSAVAKAKKTATVPSAKTKAATDPDLTLNASSAQPPLKRKRAAWDVKGRLEDMEEYSKDTTSKLVDSQKLISGLTEKLNEGQDQINQLVQFRNSLESQFQLKQVENGEMAGKLRNLEQELENARQRHENEINSLTAKHINEMTTAQSTYNTLQASFETLSLSHSRLQADNAALQSSLASQATTLLTLETTLRASRDQNSALEVVVSEKATAITLLEQQLGLASARCVALENEIRAGETARRKLHNLVQELKGNVRVFCRIRPLLAEEQDPMALSHIKLSSSDDKSLELVATSATDPGINSNNSTTVTKTYPFQFDKIFPPSATQKFVFEEISQLVQSALDGYNVCIFAYGQTGSGKTFTMEGGKDDLTYGVIPRAVRQIFDAAKELESKGWSYTFETSFLEIYNETIRDLLGTTSAGVKAPKYEIKHENGVTRVTDLTVASVLSPDEVHTLLRKASSNRAVAATLSNEHSSRSHSVFTLRLQGVNSLTQETCSGTLNLVDLAGSERLSVSGSTGDRLKETQAINKSLSALGDVIFALAGKEGGGHIPYRNSKLTYLLQNSLGGNSKTLMFVNVSPLTASFGETLCSLRFATKVNSCQIGTAKTSKK